MHSKQTVTFRRQNGYAARCDAPDCGAITFGGFPTRTAAREALEHKQNTATTPIVQPASVPAAEAHIIHPSSQAGVQAWVNARS